MDVAERIMRRRRQDSAAKQPPLGVILGKGRVRPELVKPGKGQHIILFGIEVIRDLLPVLGLLPLVITLRRAIRYPLSTVFNVLKSAPRRSRCR